MTVFDFDFRPLIKLAFIFGAVIGALVIAFVFWLFSHVSITWS